MSPESAPPGISSRMVQWFLEAAAQEVGAEKLAPALAEGGLPTSAIRGDQLARLDGAEAADLYARLQGALRRFYGRGARGLLLRTGRDMWDRLVQQANLWEKAELEIARRLPVPARRRRLLELVAAHLQTGGGGASVHSQDLDLLLVDKVSAATRGQTSDRPLCAVTLGLIQGALSWGTQTEMDVEEVACRAAGAAACEFRIRPGGR